MGELVINRTNKDLVNKFKSISKDRIEMISETMRPIIREIAESFDDNEFSEYKSSQFRISGISENIIEKLDNQSKKIGITTEQLLRLKLYEYLEKQPDFIQNLYPPEQ